jgi:hypothetical protein
LWNARGNPPPPSAQALNPTVQPPGTYLDLEFNGVKAKLDQILANLAAIQRDDTALANASVGLRLVNDVERLKG